MTIKKMINHKMKKVKIKIKTLHKMMKKIMNNLLKFFKKDKKNNQ